PAFPTRAIAAGAYINRSTNLLFEDCQFDNTTNTFVSNNTISFACYTQALTDATWSNCSFDGGQSTSVHLAAFLGGPSNAGGFGTNAGCRYLNCTANNLQQTGDRVLLAPLL